MPEDPADQGRHEREDVRLFGAPEPENFRETLEGRALAASAEIHFTDRRDQDRLLALEKLALDIFDDPLAARAFVVNPKAYMARAGLHDVELDLNSPEVRIAMALGDPAVRRAAQRGDIEGFIDAITAQGVRRGDPSTEAIGVAVVELAALLSVAGVTWATVGYSVYGGVMVRTAAAFWTDVAVDGSPTAPKRMGDHLRIIRRLAQEAGGEAFSQRVGDRVVERVFEDYARLHASAAEILGPALSPLERQELEALQDSDDDEGGANTP